MRFAAQLEFSFGNVAGTWIFPCCTEFYCTVQLINNFKRMQLFNVHYKYSFYAYHKKKLLKYRKSRKNFLVQAEVAPSSCMKNYREP
jgi:hypothetical protein